MATSTVALDSGLATSKMILDGDFEKMDFQGKIPQRALSYQMTRRSGSDRWYPCGNIHPGNRWHPREVQPNCNRRLGTYAVSGNLRKVLRGSHSPLPFGRSDATRTCTALRGDQKRRHCSERRRDLRAAQWQASFSTRQYLSYPQQRRQNDRSRQYLPPQHQQDRSWLTR